MTELELLSPARDAETGRQAILHGADAVYIGGPSHGARAAAGNSIADIASLVEYAHRWGVRVYVTLNTIIFDSELGAVERTVRDLYRCGVDALIVQDMGLLRLDLPPIDLHASTQCDIRTPEKARFLASAGFSQLVLPRELSLDEIRAYRAALPSDVSLEAFVHGALCVCYSGDCQASHAACGRSANRGECAQICRLPYSLTDADGRVLMADKHLLSLRDLNRIDDLGALADAGVSSFKIEGRLKDPGYVKMVTAAYRRALDAVIAADPTRYTRSSMGTSSVSFDPDVTGVFNRGFTSYFLHGTPPAGTRMAGIDTPKWVGNPVGTVISVRGNTITARVNTMLSNGDGLGYFNPEDAFAGFRANRVDPGNHNNTVTIISRKPPEGLRRGTVLYRNGDTRLDNVLAGNTATRSIAVDMTLTMTDDRLTLALSDDYGHMVRTTCPVEVQTARTPQAAARRKALERLGDTAYTLRGYTDSVADDVFVPASVLASLRRDAVAALDSDIAATYRYRYRRAEDADAAYPHTLTYHDNVANSKADEFYADHGATIAQRALETQTRVPSGTRVMTTRYCLRRELGACLRTPQGLRLPSPLFLVEARGGSQPGRRYLLDFDCASCRMHVSTD